VLANILAPVIIRLFDDGLADLVAPGGVLILSGILQEQVESVVSAAQAHGMELIEKKQMGDWVALLVQDSRVEDQDQSRITNHDSRISIL